MKPQIFQTKWRKMLLAPLMLGVIISFAGCGGGGKKGNTPIGFAGCSGCAVGGGTVLAASLSTWQGPGFNVQLGLRVHEPAAAYPPNQYYGPVQTSGYMVVQGPAGACTAMPIGNYQISTLPANGMYAPDLSYYPWNLQGIDFDVVHTSGYRARVHIDYAEIYAAPLVTGADGGTYSSAIYGQVSIVPITAPPAGCYMGGFSMFFPKY